MKKKKITVFKCHPETSKTVKRFISMPKSSADINFFRSGIDSLVCHLFFCRFSLSVICQLFMLRFVSALRMSQPNLCDVLFYINVEEDDTDLELTVRPITRETRASLSTSTSLPLRKIPKQRNLFGAQRTLSVSADTPNLFAGNVLLSPDILSSTFLVRKDKQRTKDPSSAPVFPTHKRSNRSHERTHTDGGLLNKEMPKRVEIQRRHSTDASAAKIMQTTFATPRSVRLLANFLVLKHILFDYQVCLRVSNDCYAMT